MEFISSCGSRGWEGRGRKTRLLPEKHKTKVHVSKSHSSTNSKQRCLCFLLVNSSTVPAIFFAAVSCSWRGGVRSRFYGRLRGSQTVSALCLDTYFHLVFCSPPALLCQRNLIVSPARLLSEGHRLSRSKVRCCERTSALVRGVLRVPHYSVAFSRSVAH